MERSSVILTNIPVRKRKKQYSMVINQGSFDIQVKARPSFNINVRKKTSFIGRSNNLKNTEILNLSKNRSSVNFRNTESFFMVHQRSGKLLIKLRQMLSEMASGSSEFDIYSQVFKELVEHLPEYKDVLMTLREGLVLSGIRERDFRDFEFKEVLKNQKTEISELLEKEKDEKRVMVNKMNKLEDVIVELKEENKKLAQKFEDYIKIFVDEPRSPNETYNLIDKVLDQDKTIAQQQSYIQKLQFNESKLRAYIKTLEDKSNSNSPNKEIDQSPIVNPCLKINLRSPKFTKVAQ